MSTETQNATNIPEPGIYKSVPFETYLTWQAVSNSTALAALAKSPAHYRAAIPRPSTADQRFGQLVHAVALEPVAALGRYVVCPDFTKGLVSEKGQPYKNPRATNQYKALMDEFETANVGKEIVEPEDYRTLRGLSRSLAESTRSREYLAGCDMEVSVVWNDPKTGLLCKGRLDAVNRSEHRITDLKTTRDMSRFAKAIGELGYDRQLAFYSDGMAVASDEPEWQVCLIPVEKAEPYCVCPAPLGKTTLAVGRRKYRAALDLLAACIKNDSWPGYPDPDVWELPDYLMPAVALTVGGETISVGG